MRPKSSESSIDSCKGKSVAKKPGKPKITVAHAVDTGRFPVDELLRNSGFRIWERPNNRKQEPLWYYNKHLYTQEEALAMLDKNEVANAEADQELYYDNLVIR